MKIRQFCVLRALIIILKFEALKIEFRHGCSINYIVYTISRHFQTINILIDRDLVLYNNNRR